jgi:zinc protease
MASKGVRPWRARALPRRWTKTPGRSLGRPGRGFEASAGSDALQLFAALPDRPALLQRAALLAARQMAEPSWPADIWQRERARWSASLKRSRTRPATVAGEAFATAVYGSHPYGQRATPETLARIEVADMQAFHARTIAACRARVSIVGAVNRAQAQTLVATLLARLPQRGGRMRAPAGGARSAGPHRKGRAAGHSLRLGPGPCADRPARLSRRDPDFLALLVGNHILGGGGFHLAPDQEVREKRGLSYSVYSYFAPGLHAGAFTIGLQTRPDQAARRCRWSRDVLQRFVPKAPPRPSCAPPRTT